MDSKITDRLLAGVEYERTRKDSPDVSWEERRKNFDRIPEHPRVPQTLDNWVADGWL